MTDPINSQHLPEGAKGFQFIENLSTAYWYSEVLFTALEADLFTIIDQTDSTLESLSARLCCDSKELSRFLKVLESLELIKKKKNKWFNCDQAAKYLVTDSPSCMKDFFLYRRYMQPQWMELCDKIAPGKDKNRLNRSDDYAERTRQYVRAMDTLVKEKMPDILKIVSNTCQWQGPVLDVGGGAGSFGRSFIRSKQDSCIGTSGLLFDLPEVIEAAKQIYPNTQDWESLSTMGGDFRTHAFNEKFGLIILSNFLHVYSPQEAKELLEKAVSLLNKPGTILIHDYFPDRAGTSPHKGPLYDINMMLNTYNGQCHTTSAIKEWLSDKGMQSITTMDLSTDSSIIISIS